MFSFGAFIGCRLAAIWSGRASQFSDKSALAKAKQKKLKAENRIGQRAYEYTTHYSYTDTHTHSLTCSPDTMEWKCTEVEQQHFERTANELKTSSEKKRMELSFFCVIEKLLVIFWNLGSPSDILNIDLLWSLIDIKRCWVWLLLNFSVLGLAIGFSLPDLCQWPWCLFFPFH